MGTDIHQYNLIYDAGTYTLTGESLSFTEWSYSCSKIPELVPDRNYMIFGVLAGVRAADFEIFKDRNEGYPAGLSQAELSLIETDRHSPVWYYCPKLLEQLKETAKKMKRRMAALRRRDAFFNGSWEEAELEGMIDTVNEIISKLETARSGFTSMESWEKSIIIFNFDS